jgi:hypothetical protein
VEERRFNAASGGKIDKGFSPGEPNFPSQIRRTKLSSYPGKSKIYSAHRNGTEVTLLSVTCVH